MGMFGKKKNSFIAWLQSATDQELADGYESRRLEWLTNGQNGTGIKTLEMQMIGNRSTTTPSPKTQALGKTPRA